MVQDDRLLRLQGVIPQHRAFVKAMQTEFSKRHRTSDITNDVSGALYLALQAQGYITEASNITSITRLDELKVDEDKLGLLVQEMAHQASWEHMGSFSGVINHNYKTTDTLYQLVTKFILDVNDKIKAHLAFANEFSHGPGYGLRNDGTFLPLSPHILQVYRE